MAFQDTFGELIKSFNNSVEKGEYQAAKQMGATIIQLANNKLDNDKSLSPQLKSYYEESRDKVKQVLLVNCISPMLNTYTNSNGDENKFAKHNWFSDEVPNLSMKDVAGLQDVKTEFLVNIFAPLSPTFAPIYRKYRKDMGLQILLYGPPGTGKTHIVKCLAGQLGCHIAVVQIKDIMASLVGDGAKIISEIFNQALKYDKCIIFIDEIDAIASSREDEDSRHTKEQLTTLLTNMDGFTSNIKEGQIRIIIAATNRPWALDSAVKRGGRFDTQIYVPLPDLKAREELISLALGKNESVKDRLEIPCGEGVTVPALAKRLKGYAGADIQSIIKQMINRPLKREISYYRKYQKRCDDCVTMEDVNEVLNNYINSITSDMLIKFDAYKKNMNDFEYERLLYNNIKKLAVSKSMDVNSLAKNDIITEYEADWYKTYSAIEG